MSQESLRALSQDYERTEEARGQLERELERVNTDLERYKERDEDLAARINNNQYFLR